MCTRAAAVAFLIAGAIAMADDKKDDKRQPLTFRRWLAAQKEFDKASDARGELRDYKAGKAWKILGTDIVTAPTVGSELIEKDGTAWVVEKVSGGPDPYYICYAKKKDTPEKD